jgi:hypothetical protein
MARRFEVDKINLEAYEVEPFINEKYVGFVIKWDSDIGFGEYTIYKAVGSDKWQADSEHMDTNEDKAFLKELLKLFVGSLEVVD